MRRGIGISVVIGLFVLIPLLWDTPADQWLTAFGKPDEPWETSPTFDLLDEDGSVVYADRVVGVEGRIGFLKRHDFIANAPETTGKMFWYVWGDPKKLIRKPLVAMAVHQQTDTKIVLDQSQLSSGSLYGEDVNSLTSFKPFPLKGQWRIDVYIDGDFYESIVVHVKDEYVQTNSAQFHISKEDVLVGKTNTALVVKGDKNDNIIEVKATSINDPKDVQLFKFYMDGQGLSLDGGTETLYSGDFIFNKPGKWRIQVLGENTVVDVREAIQQ